MAYFIGSVLLLFVILVILFLVKRLFSNEFNTDQMIEEHVGSDILLNIHLKKGNEYETDVLIACKIKEQVGYKIIVTIPKDDNIYRLNSDALNTEFALDLSDIKQIRPYEPDRYYTFSHRAH